jgi:hypothetical protein
MQTYWVSLLAAGALLYNAIGGLVTGRATLIYRTMVRGDNPILFWLSVALSGALGGATLLAILMHW